MSKMGDLRKLSEQPFTQEHFAEMHEQAFGEKNDRGACLLFASNLENALDAILTSWCAIPRTDAAFLFQSNGIFGTFSRKIESARALGIIGPVTGGNLTIIRHVRNAFAHAKLPIDFRTSEIAAACEDLVRINPMPPHGVLDKVGWPARPVRRRLQHHSDATFPLLNDIEHHNAFGYAEGRLRQFPRLRPSTSPQIVTLNINQ